MENECYPLEMNTYPVTESMRQITLQAMRQRKMNQTDLATAIGLGKAWVTKFLDGSMKTMREQTMFDLQDLLGIQYFTIEKAVGDRSPLANKLAAAIDSDPQFAKLTTALYEVLLEARATYTPRFVPTKEMSALGKKIIAIASENPEKPGKVARLVLELLA
jgi:DNA-binding Xre family transcriptional regulator